jgi:hypothetical protein
LKKITERNVKVVKQKEEDLRAKVYKEVEIIKAEMVKRSEERDKKFEKMKDMLQTLLVMVRVFF